MRTVKAVEAGIAFASPWGSRMRFYCSFPDAMIMLIHCEPNIARGQSTQQQTRYRFNPRLV